MKNTTPTQNSRQLETIKPNSQHHQHPELSDEELLLVVGGAAVDVSVAADIDAKLPTF